MKILVGTDLKEKYLEKIRQVVPEAQVIASEQEDVVLREIEDANIFVIWSQTYKDEYLQRAKRLEWIQALTAGVDTILSRELKESGIKLTTASGIHGIPISEHFFGILLALTRKIYKIYHNQLNRTWERPYLDEIYGKRITIVGLGNIGSEIARKAKAFGMEVWGVKRTLEEVPHVDHVFTTEDLHQAIKDADFVLSVLPLTVDTEKLIGKKEFAVMKKDAYFFNFGRGPVVDEQALVEALQNGEIKGAGLDVYEQEPLPEDSPLWEMEEVIISPHTSAISSRYMERAVDLFVDNLKRYISGEELFNLVDYKLGY